LQFFTRMGLWLLSSAMPPTSLNVTSWPSCVHVCVDRVVVVVGQQQQQHECGAASNASDTTLGPGHSAAELPPALLRAFSSQLLLSPPLSL
jgi:hypothetical protein